MKRNIQFIVLVLAALCLNTEDAFAQTALIVEILGLNLYGWSKVETFFI